MSALVASPLDHSRSEERTLQVDHAGPEGQGAGCYARARAVIITMFCSLRRSSSDDDDLSHGQLQAIAKGRKEHEESSAVSEFGKESLGRGDPDIPIFSVSGQASSRQRYS